MAASAATCAADDRRGASLSVSEHGSIEGSVEVPNVVLNGHRHAATSIARERVVLGAKARVQGNVYYGVIEMTLGAEIMGKLVRAARPVEPAAGLPQPRPADSTGLRTAALTPVTLGL